MMKKTQILSKTRQHIKTMMEGEGSGHDWWHVVRVVNNALTIADKEGGDKFVIELGALLHDIADHKFYDGDMTVGPRLAREWLTGVECDQNTIDEVVNIVENVSFKGGLNKHVMKTIEGKIVQDADRLDALGAIGIGRTFAFGGAMGKEMYNPGVQPSTFKTIAEVQKDLKQGHTINHFYEKLLTLKNKMNTKSGRVLALERHEFMEKYLEQFYAEWEGKR